MMASMEGHLLVVQLLIEKEADLNVQDVVSSITAPTAFYS